MRGIVFWTVVVLMIAEPRLAIAATGATPNNLQLPRLDATLMTCSIDQAIARAQTAEEVQCIIDRLNTANTSQPFVTPDFSECVAACQTGVDMGR